MRFYVPSELLGKVTIVTLIDSRPYGEILVSMDVPPFPAVKFWFISSKVPRELVAGETQHETIARYAMGAVIKRGAAIFHSANAPVMLEFDGMPWLGKVNIAPLVASCTPAQMQGGAYSGPDRRSDFGSTQVIDRAVDALLASGRDAAMAIMNARKIPEHTAIRVVSCAAFRRMRAPPYRPLAASKNSGTGAALIVSNGVVDRVRSEVSVSSQPAEE